jgi:hypothetical protein
MPLLSNLLSQELPQTFYKFQLQIYSGVYLLGLLGFVYLSSPAVSRRAYISENALSPGLVTSDLFVSNEHLRVLIEQLRTGFKSNNISNVIQSILVEHGIESYKQDIQRNTTGKHQENVYGIVRAPRTASTESIILVAPLRARAQTDAKTTKANVYGRRTHNSNEHRLLFVKALLMSWPSVWHFIARFTWPKTLSCYFLQVKNMGHVYGSMPITESIRICGRSMLMLVRFKLV